MSSNLKEKNFTWFILSYYGLSLGEVRTGTEGRTWNQEPKQEHGAAALKLPNAETFENTVLQVVVTPNHKITFTATS